MAGIITTAGLTQLAHAQATGQPFLINQILFCLIEGLDPNSTPSLVTTKPTPDKIKFTAQISSGFLNNNTCHFKAQLGPDIGPFQFNWVGLYSSVTESLVAVNFQPIQQKIKTTLNEAGNIIVKTFSIQYTQVKELTGVTISADLDSWDVAELISAKADINHSHTQYAPTTHGHAGYANATHAHQYEDLPGLSSDLANKAPLTHSHAGYAQEQHKHLLPEVTGLVSQLWNKAPIDHTHAGLLPTGFIMYWDGTTPPAGFLELNGAELSKTAYAALYAVCGNRHGHSADGTKFKLRDARGEFIRCWDNGRGVDVGRGIDTHQSDEYRSHTHGWRVVDNDPDNADYIYGGVTARMETNPDWKSFGFVIDNWATASDAYPNKNKKRIFQGHNANSASGFNIYNSGGNETRPRNIALMLVIKY